ncbi:MAG TPA: NUDIX hydrolase [Syntrophorhabdus sp.]|nr:NUDIX hydrolase [Syntrophorhabdus sp.]HQB34533.1 NUDIX hydrolase [Syntrophorhabdus sp.]
MNIITIDATLLAKRNPLLKGVNPALCDTLCRFGSKDMRHTNNKIQTPLLTVDIIIRFQDGIVLIERKNPPPGWALPGGFVDVGESLEKAAIREAKEETSLNVTLVEQFHAYSKPGRDPRFHTVTMVFIADGTGTLKGRDDARKAQVFTEATLPTPVAFDHGNILFDYFSYIKTGLRPQT